MSDDETPRDLEAHNRALLNPSPPLSGPEYIRRMLELGAITPAEAMRRLARELEAETPGIVNLVDNVLRDEAELRYSLAVYRPTSFVTGYFDDQDVDCADPEAMFGTAPDPAPGKAESRSSVISSTGFGGGGNHGRADR